MVIGGEEIAVLPLRHVDAAGAASDNDADII
jgi:hypothetical protein